MQAVKILAIVLIVVGLLGLAYEGITYTKREKVLEVGPITATKETKKTIPLPPILGGAALFLDPCIPRTWTGFSITFRYHASRYEVQVENPHGVTRGISRVEIDGVPAEGGRAALPLVNDGATHHVRVWLG